MIGPRKRILNVAKKNAILLHTQLIEANAAEVVSILSQNGFIKTNKGITPTIIVINTFPTNFPEQRVYPKIFDKL